MLLRCCVTKDSNRQILAVSFFNIPEVKLIIGESAIPHNIHIIFWEKSRIPTGVIPNCVECKKAENFHKLRKEKLQLNLDI